MEEIERKYDVAFSFLEQDKALALQINDLLRDRMKTFVYCEHQDELAGTDGEKTFNSVFGEEARVVVVLYRQEWGTTPWTRIEEIAIRNRGYAEGYDFVTFFPLDKPPMVPKWLPKARLWGSLDRWGTEGAASVIEARVQEAGGSPHEETAEERAHRLNRSVVAHRARQEFLGSEIGVRTADTEARKLLDELQRLTDAVTAGGGQIKIEHLPGQGRPETCSLNCLGYRLVVQWFREFGNTLSGSVLGYRLDRQPRVRNGEQGWRVVSEGEVDFDIEPSVRVGWRRRPADKRLYSSEDLADTLVKELLGSVEAEKPWER